MGNYNLEIMSNKKIAIVDCNNFYVSCERLFNPKLKTAPTVVLSNNDGCVIARSQEIKDMGVKMGQPVFKLDNDIKEKMVKFSSNYVLYGDISDRISNILRRFTNQLEIYSIDESFMDLSHVSDDELNSYMTLIKSEILRLTGIPVSIGVGPNKTIAKLMNYQSKKNSKYLGVCSYFDSPNIDDIEVDEVWGIGNKWRKKLNNIGINYIGQFKELQAYQVRKMFTIVGLRTWMELHGDLIYNIETKFKRPKVVTSSRSFGRTVWQKEQVSDAIWTFVEDACSKMKSESIKGRTIIFFATTNRFEEDYFVWSRKMRLYTPSNDVQSIWNEISLHLQELPIKLWAKAGVIFLDLIDENVDIKTLFQEDYPIVERPKVSSQMWMTRRDFLSPKWTTDWNDIPKLS
jgi:DNA polymerase V